MYVEQWIVGDHTVPSDVFFRLCCARKANILNKPITYKVWDWNNPDDMIQRIVPANELCQCCETSYAKYLGYDKRQWNRSGWPSYVEINKEVLQ